METHFEWDEAKRRSNVEKHGIDFADAVEVFGDPKRFTFRSSRPASELRYVTIGMGGGILMAVVTTQRRGHVRIISARATRRNERAWYERAWYEKA